MGMHPRVRKARTPNRRARWVAAGAPRISTGCAGMWLAMSTMMRRAFLALLPFGFLACEQSAPGPLFDTGSGNAPATATTAVAAPAPAPRAEAPADPGFGDVAFKTFRSGGTAVQFTTRSKAEMWWANMAGETVHGTYEQRGSEIVVHWDPKYTNNGSSQERFHQMGPCSMARYERTDRRTGKVKEDTLIYQQSQPRCDTVRLSK
jgi:hypothetical protein